MNDADNGLYLVGVVICFSLLTIAHGALLFKSTTVDFYQRLRTWRIYVPVLLLVIALPSTWVAIGFLMLMIYCLHELLSHLNVSRLSSFVFFLCLGWMAVAMNVPDLLNPILWGALFCLGLAAFPVPIWPKLGLLALVVMFPFWFAVLQQKTYQNLMFILIFLAGLTDISAYLGGRWVGGRRMAPVISPNKTWAGAVLAVAVSALVGSALIVFMPGKWAFFEGFLIGGLISILAQVGDLLFSATKRTLNIKDFDNRLPGIGGVLDRVDSLTLLAPMLILITP